VLEEFFQRAPDPFVVLDEDGVIVAANDAFAALVPGAGPGSSFLDVHGDPSRVRIQMALLSTTGGETVAVEAPGTGEGQASRRVEYRFFPLDDGALGAIGRVGERSVLGSGHGDSSRGRASGSAAVPDLDPLTGLWTRERLLDCLAAEWIRAQSQDEPLACVVLRIDGLERVSREDGTDVAEALLKAVASRIKTLLREHDAVGRYGEDRFMILAHRCEENGARLLGHRIAREIAMTRFAVRGGLHRISIRIGCGVRSRERTTPESILLAADEELQQGR
jgi:diguanylate cyclase (GGDEF)-like protein